MDMMVGKPYSFKDFNCWDYVCEIRKQVGLNTELFSHNDLYSAYATVTREMAENCAGLSLVESHRDFDVAIVKKETGKRPLYHVGVVIGKHVFHCSMSAKQVVYESLIAFETGYDELTIWR